ncbi:7779_t:CDS:2, partial [Gigaspora rosea]
VHQIVDIIKSHNAIASQVHVCLLQIPFPKFPPCVIALIANQGKETAISIFQLHKKLLDMAAQLQLKILGFGADGASAEFNTQNQLMQIDTLKRLIFKDRLYARYDQILELKKNPESVLYKKDVEYVDRQDDGAAYRLYCSSLLNQVINKDKQVDTKRHGLFIFLFVLGELIDAFQNRKISLLERCRMVMLGFFFLNHWKSHVQSCAQDYPEFMSIKKNFLAPVTFKILTSLPESMILLTIAYQDFYPQYPFTLWMYGSEGCEHFFGLAHQFLPDFAFNDLVALTPKIACLYKAYSPGSLKSDKEKTTGVGYISHYSDSSVVENLDVLRNWPSNDDIKGIVHHAYKQATALARDILGMVINTRVHDFTIISDDDEVEIENKNETESRPAELQNDDSLQIAEGIISIAATEVNTWDKFGVLTEIEEGDDFSVGCSQLDMILGSS